MPVKQGYIADEHWRFKEGNMRLNKGATAGWLLVFGVLTFSSAPAWTQNSVESKLIGRWDNGYGFEIDFRRSGGYIVGCLTKVPSGWTGKARPGVNLFTAGVLQGQQVKGLWAQFADKGCPKLPVLFVPGSISVKDAKTLILNTQRAHVGSQTHMITGEVRNCRWLKSREPDVQKWTRVGGSAVGDESLVTLDDFREQVLQGKDGKKPFFDRVDRDGNGCLSQAEINAAISNPNFKGKDAEALTVIYNNPGLTTVADSADGDSCNGVSRQDIALVGRNGNNNSTIYKNLEAIRQYRDKTKGNLFGPGDSISPGAIQQGGLEDCNFLSPLTSFSNTDEGKKAIREMIKPAGKDKDGNDQYTVTFHDPKNPGKTFDVTVSKPTEAEMINFAKGTHHGAWPAVIEKAYGKYRQNHDQHGNPINNTSGPNDPVQLGVNGHTSADSAITLLTGKKTENVSINSYFQTKDDLDKKLTNAFAGKKPIMTAAIEGPGEGPMKKPAAVRWLLQPRGGLDGSNTQKSGLYAGHEYSVLGYDPKSKQVTMRNPYGFNSAKDPSMNSKDGVFKMSLDDFQQNFSHYTLAK